MKNTEDFGNESALIAGIHSGKCGLVRIMGIRFEVLDDFSDAAGAMDSLKDAAKDRIEQIDAHLLNLQPPTPLLSATLALLIVLLIAARLSGRAGAEKLRAAHLKTI